MGFYKTQGLFLLALWGLLPSVAGAAVIAPQAACLGHLWDYAATVVDGTIEGVDVASVSTDRGTVPATVYSLKVIRVFKGEGLVVGDDFSFSQFGTRAPSDGAHAYIPEIETRYTVGKRYLLFLRGESRLGLSSPVGLQAGKFDVITLDDGTLAVDNGLHNNHLLDCKIATDKAGTRAVQALQKNGGGQAIPYDSMAKILNGFRG